MTSNKATVQTQLNNFFDANEYFDTAIDYELRTEYLVSLQHNHIRKMVDDEEGYLAEYDADFMYDVLDYEDECVKNGTEPTRRFHYRTIFEDDLEGFTGEVTFPRKEVRQIIVEYTQEDVDFFLMINDAFRLTYVDNDRVLIDASDTIIKKFNGNNALILEGCKQLIHSATKDDFKAYCKRLEEAVDDFVFMDCNEEYKDALKKETLKPCYSNACSFLELVCDPFIDATRQLNLAEFQKDPHKYVSEGTTYTEYLYKEARAIHEEIRKVASTWYISPQEKELRLQEKKNERNARRNANYRKLAQSKETNAVRFLDLKHDHIKEVGHSTDDGGIENDVFFIHNGVEIYTSENVRLSTESREMNDFVTEVATAQITHGCNDWNVLRKQRLITLTVDDVALRFKDSTDKNAKKYARDLMQNYYDDMRDYKFTRTFKDKEGRFHEQTVNLFDASERVVEYDNTTVKNPADVPAGEQVSLYNTGVLVTDGTHYKFDKSKLNLKHKAVKNGKLSLSLSMEYAQHLAYSSIIEINPVLYRLDKKKYEPAYYIGFSLALHKRMNNNASNSKILSIKNILKDCPVIPHYEDVMQGNGNVKARIKEPLIKNLEELKDANFLTEYSIYNGKSKVSKDSLLAMKYDTFIKCNVHFDLADF